MLSTTKNALQQATPESQGIASSAILQFVEAVESQIHELHSFILMRHGKVVAEGWWSPYRRENPHMLFSLSKSFTSTAVGLAVSEGHFSLDDKVISFFPDDLPAEVNEHLAAMQVRHLLSMSTGHHDDTMPPMGERRDGNWTKGFFEVPVVHQPGTHFLYNTGATYMVSAIIQKTTGMKLVDYLKPRLFDPLGIENPVWEESPQRINTGGFGLSITTDDIARFGQIYLQKGLWEGLRIIPEAWIEEATNSHISNGDNPESDWNQGYGYQFWRCKHNAYRGDGAFGQYCVVMPEQDAVLAITSGLGDMQEPLNLVWDILLPAMKDEPLPTDTRAQAALANKLNHLAIQPVQGKFTSTTSAKVLDRIYKLDTGETLRHDEPKFESLALNFTESTCIVTLKTRLGEEHITCGFGTWQKGQTKLFSRPPFFEPVQIVASAAWTDEDKLSIVIRAYETPFTQTLVCHFTDDKLTLGSAINVSFQPPRTVTFTGHPIE